MTVQDSAAQRIPCQKRVCAQEWGFPKRNILGAKRPKEGIPMSSILGRVRFSDKEKLCKQLRRIGNAGVRVRYLIVINLLNGRSARTTAEVLRVHNTTVYRVAKRFRQDGERGLWDARGDKGETKLDERFLTRLYEVVRATPQRYGWRRPTWTRELLVETMVRKTGTRVHVTTMSRALGLVGGAARPAEPNRELPVGESGQNTASERASPAGGDAAATPCGGLRRRGRYPSQSENWPGLDGAWPTKGSPDTGQGCQTISRRRFGCTQRAVALGRGRAQNQRSVYCSAPAVDADLSASTRHPH